MAAMPSFVVRWLLLCLVAVSGDETGVRRQVSPVRREIRTGPTEDGTGTVDAYAKSKALEANKMELETENAQQDGLETETTKFQRVKAQVEFARKHNFPPQEMKELEGMLEHLRDEQAKVSSLMNNETKNVEQESAKFWRDKASVEMERNNLVEKLDSMQKQLKAENHQLRLDRQSMQAQVVANDQALNIMQLQHQQEKTDLSNQFNNYKQELDQTRGTMRQDVQGLKGQLNGAKAVNEQLMSNLVALTEAKVELETKLAMQPLDALKAAEQETAIQSASYGSAGVQTVQNMTDEQKKQLSDAREKKVNKLKYQRNDAIAALVALLVVAMVLPCFFWGKQGT